MNQDHQQQPSPPSLAAEGGSAAEQTTLKSKKEKKAPPNNIVIPPKKPKLSKAERRALQEAQRAAKGQKVDGGDGQKKEKVASAAAADGGIGESVASTTASVVSKKQHQDRKTTTGPTAGTGVISTNSGAVHANAAATINDGDKTLNFFSHLPPYKYKDVQHTNIVNSNLHHNLHPEIISLGIQYQTGAIRGANARAKAMLYTFQKVIRDYNPSSSPSSSNKKDIRTSIEHDVLKPAFHYLSHKCRPHSVTMGNAFTFLKKFVMDLNRDMIENAIHDNDTTNNGNKNNHKNNNSLETIQDLCCEAIDAYIHERIVFADKAICKYARTKIVHGDVILTYANSEVIQALLLHAHSKFQPEHKSFRVIVVDSRPALEGRQMLNVLAQAGIPCTYIFLNSLSYVMKEVTKVFMGAAALMSDGSILSRVGTASVALMAQSNNIPVLICCETYKITSRVQLESITSNELGNPDDLLSTHCAIDRTRITADSGGNSSNSSKKREEQPLEDWRSVKALKLLNLLYDLTPSEFVSGIVTEMGILPPTSVAVLLREMNPQDNDTTFKLNA